jgi:CRP-like cAMP-binding protein
MKETPEVGAAVQNLATYRHRAMDETVALYRSLGGRPRHVPARQDLVCEGRAFTKTVYVISGWLCRYKRLEDGRSQIISIVLPGDLCPVESSPDRGAAFSLRTISDAVIFEIDLEKLDESQSSHQPLMDAVREASLLETAILREGVLSLGQRTAVERCAHFICELYWRLRAVGLAKNLRFKFPITQEELAETIGISTVHANRVLRNLRNLQLIELAPDKTFEIRNLEALQKVALFSPTFLQLKSREDAPPARTNAASVSRTWDQGFRAAAETR